MMYNVFSALSLCLILIIYIAQTANDIHKRLDAIEAKLDELLRRLPPP